MGSQYISAMTMFESRYKEGSNIQKIGVPFQNSLQIESHGKQNLGKLRGTRTLSYKA